MAGDFTQIGGVQSTYVAKWDGSNWTAVSLDPSNDYAASVEVYQGKLYVGTFSATASQVYEMDLMTGAAEGLQDIVSLQVRYLGEEIALAWESHPGELEVIVSDLQGRILVSDQAKGGTHRFTTEGWAKGLYLVSLREKGQIIGRTKVLRY